MGYPVAQNATSTTLDFLLVLASDHITGATGKTVTVTLCKSGGAFSASTGSVTEKGNGWYAYAPSAVETNTLGPLLLHATASACDPRDDTFYVTNYNPQVVTPVSPSSTAGSTRVLQILEDAASEVGINAEGESLSANNATVLLNLFRRLLNLWNADRRAVYATSFLSFTISPPVDPADPITIGPTGDWVTDIRPVSIDGANLVLTSSTPPVQLPIKVRDARWWLNQSVPELTTTVPTDLYYQPDWPNGKCFFWPVPTTAYDVQLMCRVLLDESVALASTFSLPPGYRQAMTLTLAEMAARPYGIPPERISTLRADASAARALVFGNNDQIPRLRTADYGMTPGAGGRRADFNWLNGSIV